MHSRNAAITFCAKLLLICMLANASSSNAQERAHQRQGYSVLGAGFSVLDYEESSALTVDDASIDIETESASIFTQSSGTFVSVGPTWGFYLHTLSTLGVPEADEDWELNDVVVRSSSVSFDYQRLELLASRRFKTGRVHTIAGLQYSSLEYRRFGAELTDAAATFGIDDTTFESGTVSETVWDISAMAGVEYNTVFTDSARGWRHQGRLLLGVPLYSNIVNTSVANGKSFSDNFNGIQARGLGLVGFQFSANIFVGASLEVSLTRKNEIDREVDGVSGVTRFPSTVFVSVFPSLGVYWSF
ncbi:MAG: hypothetical protein AB8B63_01300 [Granulosicoccus sp.]